MKKTILAILALLSCCAASAGTCATGMAHAGGYTWISAVRDTGNGASALVLSRAADTAGEWEREVKVIDRSADALSVSDARLWTSPDGRLWLFYTESRGFFDGKGSLKACFCTNPDDASPKWSEPVGIGAGVCTGEPVVLSDGSFLLPAALWGRSLISGRKDRYGNFRNDFKDKGEFCDLDSMRGPLLYSSSDEGRNWSCRSGFVSVPEMVEARFNNPKLVPCKDGLKMVLRSCGTGWSYQSRLSADGNWTAAETFVLNPDSELCVLRLLSGRLLLVKQNPFDNMEFLKSYGLYAYLSEDDGRTWFGGLRLTGSPKAETPLAVQRPDSTVVLVFNDTSSVKLMRLTEKDIEAVCADGKAKAPEAGTVFMAEGAPAENPAGTDPLAGQKKNWSKKTIRIATYNIQYANNKDPFWQNKRLPALISLLEECRFDVFGAQEPFMPQIEDMMKEIGNRYGWVGTCISGNDSDRGQHFVPIFYRKDKFDVVDWNTVWYTPRPGTPGFGACYSRLLVWARLKDRKSGLEFYMFNSHFDHLDAEAREISAEILVNAVKEIAGGMPAFLTGDFNCDEISAPYKTIVGSGFIKDSMLAVEEAINKEYFSMTWYKPLSKAPRKGRHIDHVFYTPGSVDVKSWELVTTSYDGNFGSDHLPIMIDVKIAN